MKQEFLPSAQEIQQALEGAASDLYGFGVACMGGVAWIAEPEILDVLFLGMEHFWFTEDESSHLSHKEFREEFFHLLWQRCKGKTIQPKIGLDVPLGHEEMIFYKMPQIARAALFLRTKKKFSYSLIARVLEVDEGVARSEVEGAREFLLGRGMQHLEWEEF